MPPQSAWMNQRKHKLDLVSEAENKRRRPDEAECTTTKRPRRSSQLKRAKPIVTISSDGQSGGLDSTVVEADHNHHNQYNKPHAVNNALRPELSSDTETSSDSGISSSDSRDDEENEISNSDNDSRSDCGSLNHSSIIPLQRQHKPAISNPTSVPGSSDLQSRLATFLPQLRKANDDLMMAEDDVRIDAVQDDEDHYIEMNLGLGVLKEKPRQKPLDGGILTRESSSGNSSSSSVSDTSDGDSESVTPGRSAMRDLLGKREEQKRRARPLIQALDGT